MSAQKWTRIGAPLAVDVSPNTTQPAEGSTLGPVPRPASGNESMWLALLDGTSITVQLWAEVSPGVWVKTGSPIALLAFESAQAVVPSGVRIFAQVTAAAGNPTTLATGTVNA